MNKHIQFLILSTIVVLGAIAVSILPVTRLNDLIGGIMLIAAIMAAGMIKQTDEGGGLKSLQEAKTHIMGSFALLGAVVFTILILK